MGEKGPKKKFLVLVDVLLGYSEVLRFVLPPTSATIIHNLTDFWNSKGWPVVFCNDGEPNLDSAEFDEFLANNNITRLKEVDGTPWEGAWALWRDTLQVPGQ